MITKQVASRDEIRLSFDRQGRTYAEQHGSADRLLSYRLGLIEGMADFDQSDMVLDIGCGNGHHLQGLCHLFNNGIGIDFSSQMIQAAHKRSNEPNLSFRQDDAIYLDTIEDNTMNVVICSGSLEHMVDQRAVLQQVYRVLKPGGRISFLTPNGEYIWYRKIAPGFNMQTRHYSTDRFFAKGELEGLLKDTGYDRIKIKSWTFIPRGDMPRWIAYLLRAADLLGKWIRIASWRGGLQVYAEKPFYR